MTSARAARLAAALCLALWSAPTCREAAQPQVDYVRSPRK